MLTSEQVIKETNWRILFDYPKDSTELRRCYADYAKIYHSDAATGCADAFNTIAKLYALAKVHFDNLNGKSVLKKVKATSKDGKSYILEYVCERVEFEYTSYIGREELWIVFGENYKKYYDNYLLSTKLVSYADDNLKKEFSRLMPKIKQNFETTTGKYVIIIEKTSEVASIQDILDAIEDPNRKFEWLDRDRHCAWILSRLYNLACFLNMNKLVFNGINLKDLYVSPTFHTVLLLNGWQFCTKENERMLGTTKDIYDIMSIKCKDNKISEYNTDLESIKMVGRRLFTSKAPKALLEYVEKASTGDCFTDWTEYDEALTKAYGKRVFINWNFDIDDLITI